MTIEQLKPMAKARVIDLVSAAGVDVSDWSDYDGAAAANPKYCYEWSFVVPNKVVVLNLWYEEFSCTSNVVALCPNHHREAHHGKNAAMLRIELAKIGASGRVSTADRLGLMCESIKDVI